MRLHHGSRIVNDDLIEVVYYDDIYDEILVFVTSARLLSVIDYKNKRYVMLELNLITENVSHEVRT
jgi:hypothetical protein